jgi:hypothetical protein
MLGRARVERKGCGGMIKRDKSSYLRQDRAEKKGKAESVEYETRSNECIIEQWLHGLRGRRGIQREVKCQG